MSLHARISTLESKHSQINDIIRNFYTTHLPDEKVAKLKKKRLRIKEELEQLKRMESA